MMGKSVIAVGIKYAKGSFASTIYNCLFRLIVNKGQVYKAYFRCLVLPLYEY